MPADTTGLPGKGQTPTPTALATVQNADTALQLALKKLATDVRTDLVLRCEELPALKATEAELETVFDQLLHLLMAGKSADTRLYLHIRCVAAASAAQAPASVRFYGIEFHTNIRSCAEWTESQALPLQAAKDAARQLGGNLQVAESNAQSGCLFTLTLPGKS